MGRIVRIGLFGLLAALVSTTAWADKNDLELYRLGNPSTDPDANARFRLLVVDLGMALTPTPMHPAETLGRSGAAMEFGFRFVQIHDSATQGSVSGPDGGRIWVTEGNNAARPTPTNIPNVLAIPTLQIRKGLPFSFEFETDFQYLLDSQMFAASGGLRWSLNEGFDFLPDVTVGGRATRLLGNRHFGVLTATAEVLIGKWFGLGGMGSITPYAGWQRVWISGISEVIDFDPANEEPDDPTSDDTIFRDVEIGDNYYDRFVLGFRLATFIVQLAVEAAYQPGLSPPKGSSDPNPLFDDQEGTFAFSVKFGLDF